MSNISRVFIASSLFSFLFSIFSLSLSDDGYRLFYSAFPIFFISLFLFSRWQRLDRKHPFTFYGFFTLQFIKFVLMPPVYLASEIKGFRHLEPNGYDSTLMLLVLNSLEFVVGVIFLFFLSFIFKTKSENSIGSQGKLAVTGSYFVYYTFITFAVILYFFYPGASELISFFYIDIEEAGSRVGDVTDTVLVLVRQIFIIAVAILFLIGAYYFSVIYNNRFFSKKGSSELFFLLSILLAVLTVSIIVGERRTAQIYTAFSAIIILISLFNEKRGRILFFIITPAFLILFFMSVYKFFGAFMYGSYIEAISNVKTDSVMSSLLQIYFFGPQNLSLAHDFYLSFEMDSLGNVHRFFYDITRSFFGASFVVKGDGVLISQAFNEYIYGENTETGQVLSSMSLSIIYFGIPFFYILLILNLLISVIIETFFNSTLSLEVKYLLSVCMIRMITNIYGPTPALISYLSMSILTFGLVIALAHFFRKAGLK